MPGRESDEVTVERDGEERAAERAATGAGQPLRTGRLEVAVSDPGPAAPGGEPRGGRVPGFVVEPMMRGSATEMYRARTEGLDRRFAVPGAVASEARVGRPFHFETEFEGSRHPHYGPFPTLDPPRRLAWTRVTAETLATVDPAEGRPGCLLRMRHTGYLDEPARRRHEEAWPRVLERMDELPFPA